MSQITCKCGFNHKYSELAWRYTNDWDNDLLECACKRIIDISEHKEGILKEYNKRNIIEKLQLRIEV